MGMHLIMYEKIIKLSRLLLAQSIPDQYIQGTYLNQLQSITVFRQFQPKN